MAYALRCADSGMDLPGRVPDQDRGRADEHVELHVGEAHPDMELIPDKVDMVKGLVRTT